MTAPLPPNADELVSAYLDGEAAPDEIAFVESSDELMQRVQALRTVTTELGAPVAPADATVKETHLAAALDRFDELVVAGEFTTRPPLAAVPEALDAPTAAAPEPVTSLAAARERKRPRRLSMVAAAAAAVALLFAGIVAVGLNAGTDRDVVDATSEGVAASSADEAEDRSEAEAFTEAVESDQAAPEALEIEESADEDEAASGAALAPAPTAPPAAAAAEPPAEDDGADADDAALADDAGALDEEEDFAAEAEPEALEEEAGDAPTLRATSNLGSFVNLDELGTELQDWLRESTAIQQLLTVDPDEVPTACPTEVQELLGTDAATLLAVATVDGRPVEVHAVDQSTVVVIDATDCRPLLDVAV